MRSLFLFVVIGLLLFSCRKDNNDLIPATLDGGWKMILVTDNHTNTTMTKPASLYGDVALRFVSNNPSSGIFNGNTPTNDLGPNTYTTGSGYSISIPALNMTKVGETTWGAEFVANIREAQKYRIEPGGLLKIITLSKTLTFQKL